MGCRESQERSGLSRKSREKRAVEKVKREGGCKDIKREVGCQEIQETSEQTQALIIFENF